MNKIKEFEMTGKAIQDFKEKPHRKIIKITEETSAEEIFLASDVPDVSKLTDSEGKTHSSVDKIKKKREAVKKKTRNSKHETARTIGEIKKLRTAFSKTTGKTHGIRETEYFPIRSYYYDEDTQLYEEIDTAILEDESLDAYKTGKGYFSAKFPRHETEKEELFSFEEGMYKLTMYAKRRKNQSKSLMPKLEKGQKDRIVFEGFSKNTDVEYFVSKRGVKENIVINNKLASYRYTFLVECENLVPIFIESENRVVFNSSETGVEVFNIPAPYMVDAVGTRTDNVFFEVKDMAGKNKNTIQLSVVADAEWINADGRVFPVRIDPSATCSDCGGALNICGPCSSCDNTYLVTTTSPCSTSCSSSDSISDDCICGCCNSGCIECTINTENIPASNVSKKYLTFTEAASCQSDNIRVCLYINSNCSGYLAVLSPCKTTYQNNVITYTFDITEYYDKCNSFRFFATKTNNCDSCCNSQICCPNTECCHDDTICNNEICDDTNCNDTNCDDVNCDDTTCESSDLCPETSTSGTGSDIVVIFGENSAYPPSLIIEENIGFEGNSTVIKQDLGRYGVGSVDIYQRNMLFAFEDFSWNGNRMPVIIQHMYNGVFGTTQYTNDEKAGLYTADFSKMKIGNGWKLNLMQSMIPVTVENDKTVYIFTTASGAQIVFLESQSVDTNGEPCNKYYYGNNQEYVYNPLIRTLTTSNGESLLFDLSGRLVRIIDEHGNDISITYTNGKISSVTDSVGREFSFNYSNGNATGTAYLTSIVAPDDSIISYTYSGDYLRSVKYPDGHTVNFKRNLGDPYILLCDDNNNDVSSVKYVYDDNAQLTSVIEYSFDNEIKSLSNHITFTENGHQRTVTSNGVTYLYDFDAYGNLWGQYYKTENDSNYIPVGGEDSINLLENHSFERGVDGWETVGSPDATVDCYNGQSFMGEKSLRICGCESSEIEVGVFQAISLNKARAYTFSAYVKPESFIGNNCGVFLRVCDENGNILAESEHLSNLFSYNRLWTTFEITQAQTVNVYIMVKGNSCAYVDCVQLEPNETVSSYNAVLNGVLNQPNNHHWSLSYGDEYASMEILSCAETGYNKMEISSTEFHFDRGCRQLVNVSSSADTRETFTLSGWAEANINLENNSLDYIDFYLSARVLYEDSDYNNPETYDEFFAPFNCHNKGRQYASVTFAKTKCAPVKHIGISCCYNHVKSKPCFDNIQLIRKNVERGLTIADFEGTTSETTHFKEHFDKFGNQITDTVYKANEAATIYGLFEYDSDGNNLISHTDDRGNKLNYTVDEETSLVTSVEHRCNQKVDYYYDDAKRVKKISNKDELNNTIATVTYDYDTFDDITRITRGDGMEYSFEYNKFRQPMSIAFGKNTEAILTYEYNDNGKLKKINFANGEKLSIIYNKLGQVISETVQSGESTTIAKRKYIYDNSGNIIRTIDLINKKEYTYTYSEGNLLRVAEYNIEIDNSDLVVSRIIANVYSYTYDGKKRLTNKSLVSNGEKVSSVSYDYVNEAKIMSYSIDTGVAVNTIANFDELGRVSSDAINTETSNIQRDFTYVAGSIPQEYSELGKVKSAATTNLVKEITISGVGSNRTLSYEYDAEERITKVTDSNGFVTEYTYDAMGQLLTETVNGEVINSMMYDNYGNILIKNGVQYDYDNVWKDKLVKYGNSVIDYDVQGNPTSYLGHTLVWENGKLKSFDNNTFTYNFDGIRTDKIVNGVKHTYLLDGTKIIKEAWEENELIPAYDASGSVCGIGYNGTSYFFVRNLQGDVLAITDKNGNILAEYAYDVWGKCTVVSDTSGCNIANINPFRYRGYYYDAEKGMYYLQSRYYDPGVGRFIQPADVSTLNPLVANGINAYSYANNNAIGLSYSRLSVGCSIINAISSTFAGNYMAGYSASFDIFDGLSWSGLLSTESLISLGKDVALSFGEIINRVIWGLREEGRLFLEYHYSAYGIDGYTSLANLPCNIGKIFKCIGFLFIVADVLQAIYDSYKSQHSVTAGFLNVNLTILKNLLVYGVSTYVTTAVGAYAGAKLGASLGSAAGPVGFLIGAAFGALVGWLIDFGCDVIIDWLVGLYS